MDLLSRFKCFQVYSELLFVLIENGAILLFPAEKAPLRAISEGSIMAGSQIVVQQAQWQEFRGDEPSKIIRVFPARVIDVKHWEDRGLEGYDNG